MVRKPRFRGEILFFKYLSPQTTYRNVSVCVGSVRSRQKWWCHWKYFFSNFYPSKWPKTKKRAISLKLKLPKSVSSDFDEILNLDSKRTDWTRKKNSAWIEAWKPLKLRFSVKMVIFWYIGWFWTLGGALTPQKGPPRPLEALKFNSKQLLFYKIFWFRPSFGL